MTTDANELPPRPQLHVVAPLRTAVFSEAARAAFERERAEDARRLAMRPQVEHEGREALARLFKVAQGHSGQCRYIAAFLLGLYNGNRFPFDLTDFRAIDGALFDDCVAVMKMDARPRQEVHLYFEGGGQKFEQLAKDWNIEDRLKLREQANRAGASGSFS